MKISVLFSGLALLLFLGGFIFLMTTDIPVETKEIKKTIPNEQFFDAP